jgi:hypothetical protein
MNKPRKALERVEAETRVPVIPSKKWPWKEVIIDGQPMLSLSVGRVEFLPEDRCLERKPWLY